MKKRQHGATSITIRAAGDILLGPALPNWDDRNFQGLVKPLQNADLTLGNMECALVEKGLPRRKVDITRANLCMADELRRMGIGAVSLANNHTMDYDFQGLQSTISALRGVGIACVGAGKNRDRAFAPIFLEVNGRRIAVVACQVFFIPGFDDYTRDMRAGKDQEGVANVDAFEVRVGDEKPLALSRTTIAPNAESLRGATLPCTVLRAGYARSLADPGLLIGLALAYGPWLL